MEFLYSVGAILTSLGGGTLIVGLLIKWLGDLWAERLIQTEKKLLDEGLESYKIKLKKSEFLFQKEFEAVSEFIALFHSFWPKHKYIDYEFHDALCDISNDSQKIEEELESFLIKHSAVLGEEVVDLISDCICIACDNKLKIKSLNRLDEVPDEVLSASRDLMEKLKKSQSVLLDKVHSQSST